MITPDVPLTFERAKRAIKKLHKGQRDIFDAICEGGDEIPHPSTQRALLQHGLVMFTEWRESKRRYGVASKTVLAAWREVCDEQKKRGGR